MELPKELKDKFTYRVDLEGTNLYLLNLVFPVLEEKKFLIMNKETDECVIDNVFTEIFPTCEDSIIVVQNSRGYYGIVSKNGDVLRKCEYSGMIQNFNEGIAIFEKEKHIGQDDTDDFLLGRRDSDYSYVMVNTKGKEVSREYSNGISKFCCGRSIAEDKNFKYLVDGNGNEIKSFKANKYYFDEPYSEGLITIERHFVSNDTYKSGYMDINGNIVCKCQYVYAGPFSCGIAKVSNDPDEVKFEFIDKSFNVIKKVYDNEYRLRSCYERFIEGTIISKDKNGHNYKLYDTNFNVLFKSQYIYRLHGTESTLYAAKNRQGFWGIVDNNGKVKVPFIYNYIADTASDNMINVSSKEGLYGCINLKTFEEAVHCIYTDISPFSEGLAFARSPFVECDRNVFILNKEGKTVPGVSFTKLGRQFTHGLSSIYDDTLDMRIMIDRNGNPVYS